MVYLIWTPVSFSSVFCKIEILLIISTCSSFHRSFSSFLTEKDFMYLMSRNQCAETWGILMPSSSLERKSSKARSCAIWSSIRKTKATVPTIVYGQNHLLNTISDSSFNTRREISLSLLAWLSQYSENYIKPLNNPLKWAMINLFICKPCCWTQW